MITTRHAPSPSSPVLQAEQAVAPGFPSRPTEEAIVGILAEHRWKHLVQYLFRTYPGNVPMRTQCGTNYNCGWNRCSARKPTIPSIVDSAEGEGGFY